MTDVTSELGPPRAPNGSGNGASRAYDRVPPHSLEAEVSVLGAALLSADAAADVIQTLKPDDFYRTAHRVVFEAMVALHASHVQIDVVTLLDWLRSHDRLDEVGGAPAVHSLTSAVPTAANVAHYARIVRQKSLLRRLIDAGTTVARMGYEPADDAESVVDRAESLIYQVAETGNVSEFAELGDLLNDSFERIEKLAENRSEVTGLATGFNDLDRLTAGLQRQNLVVVAARPAMGKCLYPGLRVIDPETGEYPTIAELHERGVAGKAVRTASLGTQGRLLNTVPSEFHDNGLRTTFTLRTRLGRGTRATANHPFLTPTGWVALEDLNPGDLIAVPRHLDVFGQDTLAEAEVRILGYLLGDGCLVGTSPAVVSDLPAIADELTEIAAAFGTRVTATNKSGTAARSFSFVGDVPRVTAAQVAELADVSKTTVWSVATRGRYVSRSTTTRVWEAIDELGYTGQAPPNFLTEWLRELGLWGCGSHDKFVPEPIFRAPRDQVATFLSRLFATDGSAWVAERHGYFGISYCSVSERLIRDVQHLLLRFGIIARIREKQVKYEGARRLAYELEIRDAENVLRFLDEIGIFAKEEACDRVRAAAEARTVRHTNTDLLPIGIWDLILAEKGDRSWADVSEATGRTRNHNWHVGTRRPSRRLVAELAEALDSDRLRQWAHSDIYWDEIVSIEEYGEEPVYDLTIPELHNFVADDLILHNSSFAINLAHYVAVKLREPAIIFSLEMSKIEIVNRLLSAEANIDSRKLKTGRLDDADWRALGDALGHLGGAPLFIDDTPAINLMEIRAKCRRLKQRRGLELVIVDYLQLMQSHRHHENRVNEVGEISRGLKMLAKELDVPVIALSQLSRQPESRTDKRPQLSDLRESGSIEQDSDIVAFIYRDEVYDEDTPDKGIAELIVSKHRNGPTGTVKLAFLGRVTKFANLTYGGMAPNNGGNAPPQAPPPGNPAPPTPV